MWMDDWKKDCLEIHLCIFSTLLSCAGARGHIISSMVNVTFACQSFTIRDQFHHFGLPFCLHTICGKRDVTSTSTRQVELESAWFQACESLPTSQIFNHASSMAPGTAIGRSVSPLLWPRRKYLHNYRTDCIEICHRYMTKYLQNWWHSHQPQL